MNISDRVIVTDRYRGVYLADGPNGLEGVENWRRTIVGRFGTVVEIGAGGNIRVRFDNGKEHNFYPGELDLAEGA